MSKYIYQFFLYFIKSLSSKIIQMTASKGDPAAGKIA